MKTNQQKIDAARAEFRKLIHTFKPPTAVIIDGRVIPLPELVEDREAIHAELKRQRKLHTKRVNSTLP